MKLLSVDNQFITKEMKRMLPRHNCDIDSISPECHAQAGATEVRHRGFNAAVRSIVDDSKRDDTHWQDAGGLYEQYKNMTFSSATPQMTAYEAMEGEKPDATHWQLPLSDCWYFIYPGRRTGNRTLHKRREHGIFVGYNEASLSYNVWNTRRRITYARWFKDVVFTKPSSS